MNFDCIVDDTALVLALQLGCHEMDHTLLAERGEPYDGGGCEERRVGCTIGLEGGVAMIHGEHNFKIFSNSIVECFVKSLTIVLPLEFFGVLYGSFQFLVAEQSGDFSAGNQGVHNFQDPMSQ